MRNRYPAFLAAVLALLLALSACGGNTASPPGNDSPGDAENEGLAVSVCLTETTTTLDPAQCVSQGGENILFCLYENLMRWTDDGTGYAAVAPGQAESYTMETDYAGNATYTFALRTNIFWSDGKAVTAEDFVSAWQRLADPDNALPHRQLLSDISGYDQVQSTGDPSLLAVSAPDSNTLTVTLNGNSPYFLEEVCAGAYTMPVRADLLSSAQVWGGSAAATPTNGPYTAILFSRSLVTLQRSGTYYNTTPDGPETIRFITATDSETDYGKFLSGSVDLITQLPEAVLGDLLQSDSAWLPESISEAFAVFINCRHAPFDDVNVRLAFRLAVDTTAVAGSLGSLTTRPAGGIVPYGVRDYGDHHLETDVQAFAAEVLPDPNAPPAEEESPVRPWDYRAHSLEKVTLPAENGYSASLAKARALMAQAGFADGGEFPVVEYVYLSSDMGHAIARSLQSMWQQLGVTVTTRALSQAEYDALLTAAVDPASDMNLSYQLIGCELTALHSDAQEYLSPWYSTSSANYSHYRSSAFDILLDSADAAVSWEARDAYLHDAEAILLNDSPVIPVCSWGSSYQLNSRLSGLYRLPGRDVYFLSALHTVQTEQP